MRKGVREGWEGGRERERRKEETEGKRVKEGAGEGGKQKESVVEREEGREGGRGDRAGRKLEWERGG